MKIRKKRLGSLEVFWAIGWILTAACYFGCMQSYGRIEEGEAVAIVFSDHIPKDREVRSILSSQEEKEGSEQLCFYWDGGLVSAKEPVYLRSTRVHLAGILGEASLFDRRIRGFSDHDRDGCIIDRETAQELFGSTNVLGRELHIQEKAYAVRKVMDWKQRLVLIHPKDEEVGFSRAFYSCPKGNKTAMADQFLMRYGLRGEQAAATALKAAACGAVWLLPFLLFLELLIYGIKQKKRAKDRTERILWAGVCFLFFLMSAYGILQNIHLSADWLPGKWSDFNFWSRRMGEEREKLRCFFMVSRTAGELEMLYEAIRTILLGILGTVFYLVLMRMGKKKR